MNLFSFLSKVRNIESPDTDYPDMRQIQKLDNGYPVGFSIQYFNDYQYNL
jgi:hypothetical protein